MSFNKSIRLFIFSIAIMPVCLFSQVSGYMGKHLMVKFDTYTNLYIPIDYSGNSEINYLPIRKYISTEYIIARNVTLGFGYGFNNTQFVSDGRIGQISNYGFGISSSVYSGGDGIAPVGSFLKYQLDYYMSNFSIPKEVYFTNSLGQEQNIEVIKSGSINNYVLGLVIGQSGVLWNRVYYNYGIQFGYRLGALIDFVSEVDYTYYESDISSFKKDVRFRNFAHNLWGIQCGVGYLLF